MTYKLGIDGLNQRRPKMIRLLISYVITVVIASLVWMSPPGLRLLNTIVDPYTVINTHLADDEEVNAMIDGRTLPPKAKAPSLGALPSEARRK
jgi:hypothetical protein